VIYTVLHGGTTTTTTTTTTINTNTTQHHYHYGDDGDNDAETMRRTLRDAIARANITDTTAIYHDRDYRVRGMSTFTRDQSQSRAVTRRAPPT
jgi:hypothetical protein